MLNQMLAGALMGIVSVLVVSSIFGIVNAHTAGSSDMDGHPGHGCGMNMHSMMMGGMMMNGHMNNQTGCMGMSVEDMDKNNDGICDMCDMNVSDCESMHTTGDMMMGHMMVHDTGCMDMDTDEMDKDNDGICDMCGMSIEECKEMM